MTIEIKLRNRGKLKGVCALIDDEDYEKISNYKWIARKNRNNRIYVQHLEPKDNWRKFIAIHLHRVILDVPHDMVVDHINRNGLDNRKCNLRICTRGENQRNSIKKRDNGTKYKGISWNKAREKWEAFIVHKQKKYNLGAYNKEIDAAAAYNMAAIRYFREFARLNYIP